MYKFTFCMHDCKNIDTFIPGKMGKFLEKSGNFVREKKWEPCIMILGIILIIDYSCQN